MIPEPPGSWPPLPGAWAGPAPGFVDCVRIRLDDVGPAALAALRSSLATAERDRADRFVDPVDQARAVVGRGVLRRLLARDPRAPAAADIPLLSGPWGKPYTPGGPAFSLSHAGALVLLAFAADGHVGVDVEPAAAGEAWREVAGRLHPAEQAAVAASPDPARAFLSLWTRKEAMAKAAGIGLVGQPPAAWSVTDGPDMAPPVARWSVFELRPDAGHLAAAVASGPLALRGWSLDPGAI